MGHVQFFFEKRRWWVWKKFSKNVHFKNLFSYIGQKRGRNCLHQKNSGFTIKGDNLSVSTYSVESVDVCIHCYKFPKTKKTIIMFSTKRENHLYWLLSLLCSTTLFVCVIWSGTKGSSDFFPSLLRAEDLHYTTDKYLDFCPVSNLNAQIN